jgi:hypothetical protein
VNLEKRRSVAHVMDRAGIKHTMDEVRYLVGEIEKLKPFCDAVGSMSGCSIDASPLHRRRSLRLG